MASVKRIVGPVVVLALISCSGNAPWTALSEEPPEDWEALRRRMDITLVDGQGNQTQMQPGDFVGEVTGDCVGVVAAGPVNGGQGVALGHCTPHAMAWAKSLDGQDLVAGNCEAAACISIVGVCVAQKLIELGESPAPATIGSYTVAPQSNETRAALLERAVAVSRETIVRIVDALGSAVGEAGTTSTCTTGSGLDLSQTGDPLWQPTAGETPQTLGESLAMSLVESYDLLSDATEGAVRRNLAAADAYHSEQPSLARSARFAQQAPVLSRGHAAHLIAGPYLDGDPGTANAVNALPALSQPFNAMPPLSDRERAALSAIREAAPHFDELSLSTVSFDTFVSGTTPFGSIRERLEELTGDTLPTDADQLLAHLGTDRDAFFVAIERVRGEARDFDRDEQVKMAPRQLAGGATSTMARYAITGRAASPLPRSRWTLFAQQTPVAIDDAASSSMAGNAPTAAYSRRGVARTRDYALTWAGNLLRDGATTLPAPARGALAQLVARSSSDRMARFEAKATFDMAGGSGRVRVLAAPAEAVILVRGTAGLSCAVDGHVEGEPCDIADYEVTGGTTISVPVRTGFSVGTEWIIDGMLPDRDSDKTQEFYVAIVAGGAGPGGYMEGGGIQVHGINGGPATVHLGGPLDPEMQEIVERTIAASADPDGRGRPEDRCAQLGDRIPLENSLSDDGDPIESSWRTYLALAEQASSEADFLGEQLIERGLEMDRRAEGAAEELERLCGATVDLDALEPSPGFGHHAGPCNVSGGCDDEGYACVDGSECVWDPIAALLRNAADDPDAARVAACLGSSAMVEYVSLGGRQTCVWRKTLNKNDVCGDIPGMPGDAVCPFFAGENGSGPTDCWVAPSWLPMDYEVVVVQEHLNLFEDRDSIVDTDEEPGDRIEVCNALRTLRTDSTSSAAREVIGDSAIFGLPDMRRVARSLTWEAEPRNFSTISRNGNPWLRTGDFQNGVTSQTPWLCDATVYSNSMNCFDAGVPLDGFFCDQYDCDSGTLQADIDTRAIVNDRMARAVLAARVITGAGLDGLRFPGYFRPTLLPTYQVDDRFDGYTEDFEVVPEVYFVLRKGSFELNDDQEARFLYWAGASGSSSPDMWSLVDGLGSTVTPFNMPGISTGTVNLLAQDVFVIAQQHGDLLRERSVTNVRNIWAGMPGNPPATPSLAALPYETLVDILTTTAPDGKVYLRSCSAGGLRCERTASLFSSYWRPGHAGEMNNDSGDKQNLALIAREGLRRRDVLDALELLCQAPVDASELPSVTDACTPPDVSSVRDLPQLEAYLGCVADRISARGDRAVIANVPQVVVDVIKAEAGLGAHPRVGGDYALAVTQLRRGLIDMQAIYPMLGSEIRSFGIAVEQVRLDLRALGLHETLSDLSLASSVSSNTASCARATGLESAFGGVATCTDAIIQIGIAIRRHTIEAGLREIDEQRALGQLMDRFVQSTRGLANLMTTLRGIQEDIDAGLATIETTQRATARALGRATFADTDDAGRHFEVNTVMRRRMSTQLTRYMDARDNAIRMAHLARLAVEQRLGLDLSRLDRNLSLVDNPAEWIDSVCTNEGIDYDRIREAGDPAFEDYSSGYIGDYVDRLGRVVESYRLDFPFHDGEDTMVVSLRDDVLGVRSDETHDAQECRVPSRNLVTQSSRLGAMAAVDALTGEVAHLGWEREECVAVGSPAVEKNCVTVEELGEPAEVLTGGATSPTGSRVYFGDRRVPLVTPSTAVDPAESSLRWGSVESGDRSRYVQYIGLEPGRRYRLSYYGRAVADGGIDPATAVHVMEGESKLDTVASSMGADLGGCDSMTTLCWNRYHTIFDTFTSTGALDFRLVVEPTAQAVQAVDLGGFMVEDITYERDGATFAAAMDPAMALATLTAPEYQDTRGDLTIQETACEDTEGVRFRTDHVRSPVCELVCPASRGGCEPIDMVSQCYRDIDFTITQAQLDSGELLGLSGFARGNYNYRADGIAVNFVGTNIRDCSESLTPSTCYSSGWVPYSLAHRGSFEVSNHFNEIYDAPLFNGYIVHARGLTAERYLTNPVSSADRALIEPYTHREFRGRPLAGRYTIRIWDDPSVRFDRLEDIQLMISYRYWTRLD